MSQEWEWEWKVTEPESVYPVKPKPPDGEHWHMVGAVVDVMNGAGRVVYVWKRVHMTEEEVTRANNRLCGTCGKAGLHETSRWGRTSYGRDRCGPATRGEAGSAGSARGIRRHEEER